jgi:hypothetical protein
VRHVRHASWRFHPGAPVHCSLAAGPSEAFQGSGDTPLVGGPNSWCFDKQGLARDGQDGHGASLLVGWLVLEPFGYCLLPGIGLVAGFLLRQDVLVLNPAGRS